ncbi:MAG: hypothetical protein ACKVOS_06630 [Sphingorhabdus sp.]|uniref:hypothetical protein n=1 Tax=Sphingorhabdus sp. TaxID=1902408 RepID=UPI0038FD1BF9
MRKATLAIALCLGMATNAYAKAQYRLEIRPTNGQVENWQNGMQSVDDPRLGSTVRVVSSQDALPDKQSTFRIIVLNRSDKPVAFGPENITIEYAKGKTVQIATHEELVGKLRRDIKRRQALAVLGGALSAGGANGYTSGSFNYSGITNSGGYVSGSGTYSGYDPALAQQQQLAAQRQSLAVAQAINGRQLSGSQALESVVRRTTIPSGGLMGGVVAYTPPSAFNKLSSNDLVTIVVTVGAEKHIVTARVSKIR